MTSRWILAAVLALAAPAACARCAWEWTCNSANFLDAPFPITTVVPARAGTQVAATALGYGVNVIPESVGGGPTGPGWSVKLPPATGSGKTVEVINHNAFFAVIYPEPGENVLHFVADDTAYAIYPGTYLVFRDTAARQWEFAYNLASIFPVYAAITAHPGGGQRKATLLGYGTSLVATVATDGDSVMLPHALGAAEFCAVVNKGAKQLAVYPQPGESFQDYPPNEPMHLAPGKTLVLLDEGPPNEWAAGTLGGGYALQFSGNDFTGISPAGATTYFEGMGLYPVTMEQIQRIRIPRAGRVKRIDLSFLTIGTPGSPETSSIYFRLNGTTDTLISSGVRNDAIHSEYTNTALDIAVRAGDSFEIKWVTPAWTTNPTGVLFSGVVTID